MKHYYVRTKELTLDKAQIGIKQLSEAGKFGITTDQFVKGVWLDTEESGYFSDNYFDLLPGETKVVQFIPRAKKVNYAMTIEAKSMVEMIYI